MILFYLLFIYLSGDNNNNINKNKTEKYSLK